MPFVQAKCPICGGMLAVDDSKKAAICQFCGDAFIVEEAVNNYNTYNITNNTTNQNFGEGAVVNIIENSSSISAIMERVFMFLEEGDFFRADEYCEKALDLDPKCSEAYLGKLMVDLRCKQRVALECCDKLFDKNSNYQKIVRFGDSAMRDELNGYLNSIKERNKRLAQIEIDIEAIHKKEGGDIRNIKVLKVLYDCRRAMTISEIMEKLENNNDGETYISMVVDRSVKTLVERGYVSRTEDECKAYYEIVQKGIYCLKGI